MGAVRAEPTDGTARDFRGRFGSEEACREVVRRTREAARGCDCDACYCHREFFRDQRANRVRVRSDSLMHGTVLQGCRIPTSQWMLAAYLVASLPRGISARSLASAIGTTHETALDLLQRFRAAMRMDHRLQRPLDGDVEAHCSYLVPRRTRWDDTEKDDLALDEARVKRLVVIGMVARDATKPQDMLRLHCLPQVDEVITLHFTNTLAPSVRLHVPSRFPYVRHLPMPCVNPQGRDTEDERRMVLRVFDELDSWLRITFRRCIGRKWLHAYLDEFSFRWTHLRANRSVFNSLVHRLVMSPPETIRRRRRNPFCHLTKAETIARARNILRKRRTSAQSTEAERFSAE